MLTLRTCCLLILAAAVIASDAPPEATEVLTAHEQQKQALNQDFNRELRALADQVTQLQDNHRNQLAQLDVQTISALKLLVAAGLTPEQEQAIYSEISRIDPADEDAMAYFAGSGTNADPIPPRQAGSLGTSTSSWQDDRLARIAELAQRIQTSLSVPHPGPCPQPIRFDNDRDQHNSSLIYRLGASGTVYALGPFPWHADGITLTNKHTLAQLRQAWNNQLAGPYNTTAANWNAAIEAVRLDVAELAQLDNEGTYSTLRATAQPVPLAPLLGQ